ncbi:hypothetical protein B0H16DRAFT_1327757 [Mycena metata]|uniref:Uncharacterized protein n=1 Tax=Mycena metata TaxID=1033252 RepID=A0AAD7I373_9AGAR|nr:hypothetical protein B0H16DRAFT_1327757 [Mycena metata]
MISQHLTQSYSISKPFPQKYHYFLLAFGTLSTAAFATINIFLAGHDVITITSTHFNSAPVSDLPMWYTGSQTFGCFSHQFQLGDQFRTNISAFSYRIFDMGSSESDQSGAGGLPAGAGFLYANQDLAACDVDHFEIMVSPGDRLITVTATIACPPPLTFRALVTWSYSNHFMIGSRAVAAFPVNSLSRAITDGVRNIMGEAYRDISTGLYATNGTTQPSQQIYKVIAQGEPNCDPSPPFQCVVPPFTSYNAIGNIDLNILGASDIAADEGNLYNIVNVFYAGVRLDLGHWTADNLFTNTTSFKRLVRVTSSADPAFRAVATTHGMAYANSADPPPPDVPTPHAVVQIPYICNILQRKPIGSFAISVLSATLSMFLGTWGLMTAILSFFVGRSPGGAYRAGFRHSRPHNDSICIVLSANSCKSHREILPSSNSEKEVHLLLASATHGLEGENARREVFLGAS